MNSTQNDKVTLVQFISSIRPIPEILMQEIVSNFQLMELKRNEYLLREDELSNEYIFLESGLMRTFLFDLEGNEITTDIHVPNNVVFDVNSFFQRTLSMVNIQAITDCIAYKLTYADLNRLFHDKYEFRDFGRAVLVKEFAASKRRTISMINQTAEQRYRYLMKNHPEIILNAPLKYVASYLGITDSSLSRIRKDFTEK